MRQLCSPWRNHCSYLLFSLTFIFRLYSVTPFHSWTTADVKQDENRGNGSGHSLSLLSYSSLCWLRCCSGRFKWCFVTDLPQSPHHKHQNHYWHILLWHIKRAPANCVWVNVWIWGCSWVTVSLSVLSGKSTGRGHLTVEWRASLTCKCWLRPI